MKIRFYKLINIKQTLCFTFLLILLGNCDNVKDWKDPIDSIPPGKVTDVNIENLPGGAMITYTLPDDDDLLGVKAVYSFREGGETYENFSSAFRDTITLAGYPDTADHTVSLYVIDQSRNMSDPVDITISPLTPPIELIRESLKVNPTFGGIYLSWNNPSKENIAISLYVDSIGEMILNDTYFSNAANGAYAFRRLEGKEQSFRFEIRDRWLNYSHPLDTTLTPLYEQQIKGRNEAGSQLWHLWGFDNRECVSRGENWASPGNNRNFTILFNDNLFSASDWFHLGDDWGMFKHHVPGWPDNEYAYPAYFSIDMGKPASYSRLKIYMRARAPLFSANIFTVFELWGTNNPKALKREDTDEDRLENLRYWTAWPEIEATDEWKDDWVQLGDYSLVLPSGATLSSDPITSEDQEFIRNGFNFDIDLDKTNTPCRYLRFVVKKSNVLGRRPYSQMGELQFFGSYPE